MITLLAQNDFAFRDPDRFGQLSTIGSTYIHPLGLLGLVIACLLVMLGSRRVAAVAGVVLVCFISSGQRIVIADIDFAFDRILAVVLALRIVARNELAGLRFLPIDGVLFVFAIVPILATVLRGNTLSLLNRVGVAGDTILLYMAGRALLQSPDDVRYLARSLVYVAVPVAIIFAIEHVTRKNVAAVFGGVPLESTIRNGRIRAQGAFAHPILAGVWWATCIPFFFCLIWSKARKSDKFLGYVGFGLGAALVLMSASSTPVGGLGVALLGFLFFRFRQYAKSVGLIALCMAIFIHIIHPIGVHAVLFTNVGVVSGSTGYHRYMLIEQAMRHVNEWFLIGSNTSYHWGWGMDDVTCQYVAAALQGGVIVLTALVALIFMPIQRANSLAAKAPSKVAAVPYCLALALVVHAACFMAVTYFGQIWMLFCLTLGSAVSVCMTKNAAVKLVQGAAINRPRQGEFSARPRKANA